MGLALGLGLGSKALLGPRAFTSSLWASGLEEAERVLRTARRALVARRPATRRFSRAWVSVIAMARG